VPSTRKCGSRLPEPGRNRCAAAAWAAARRAGLPPAMRNLLFVESCMIALSVAGNEPGIELHPFRIRSFCSEDWPLFRISSALSRLRNSNPVDFSLTGSKKTNDYSLNSHANITEYMAQVRVRGGGKKAKRNSASRKGALSEFHRSTTLHDSIAPLGAGGISKPRHVGQFSASHTSGTFGAAFRPGASTPANAATASSRASAVQDTRSWTTVGARRRRPGLNAPGEAPIR
jgi:hypothetical protein